MSQSHEPTPTRSTIPDTIEYVEFDLYYDNARELGSDVKEAGRLAGQFILGQGLLIQQIDI